MPSAETMSPAITPPQPPHTKQVVHRRRRESAAERPMVRVEGWRVITHLTTMTAGTLPASLKTITDLEKRKETCEIMGPDFSSFCP